MKDYNGHNKDRLLTYKRHYRLNNKEKINKYARIWRWNNQDKTRKYQKDCHNKLQTIILQHYGNGKKACVQCGESRIPALTIDHINGGGNKHLRGLGIKGNTFYAWLRQNNFPEGYQTLCMNCQFVKRAENNECRKE